MRKILELRNKWTRVNIK